MSYISSQHHSFDIRLAAKYGIDEALMIHHFQHWIRINRHTNKNIRDGRCWSYQSKKQIQATFPYWTIEQIKYTCEQLVEKGVLLKANYNKSAIDKTTWYAFVDEEAFGVGENSNNVYERENSPSTGKIPSPIPDTKEQISKSPIVPKGDLPSSSKRKRISEEKEEVAKHVLLTKTQREDLLKKASGDEALMKSWIEKLSTWKISKNIAGGNDYLSITNWVMRAVAETPQGSITSKESLMEQNKKLAQAIAKRFPDKVKLFQIQLDETSIEFIFGGMLPSTYLKFSAEGFKEQAISALRKMKLDVSGL